MGRRRVNHRNLLGVVACAVFAVFSILRESIGTRSVLEYVSEGQHSYSAIHWRVLQNDFLLSIDLLYKNDKNLEQNATVLVLPRVVVLSASPADNDWRARHISNDWKEELNSALPAHILDLLLAEAAPAEPSRMEMPEVEQIDFDHEVYQSFEREWYEDCEQVRKDHDTSAPIVGTTCNNFSKNILFFFTVLTSP